MKRLKMGMMIVCLGWLCACSADYYRAAALREARAYAVDELRELDETDISYIRFASPEFYAVPLYAVKVEQDQGHFASELISMRPSGLDQTQKRDILNRHYIGSFMWMLPETQRVVIVTGICESDFAGWSAQRVVHRPLLPANPYKLAALRAVRDFVLYSIEPEIAQAAISDHMRNYIRFAPPDVYRRSMIESGADSTLVPTELTYTFAWEDPETHEAFFVLCTGSEDFKKFTPDALINSTFSPDACDSKISNFTELPSHKIDDYLR